MHSTYNLWLVALSLVVAILASYTALDLAGHISKLGRSRLRHIWLAGGATAMGIGIWSMHFIGMLAFSLPIPLGYDLVTTGHSLVIAILLSYFVLYIVTQGKLTLLRLTTEGFETASQFAQLKGMMCDQMQGFLLGKSMSAEEFSALLHEQSGRDLILLRRPGYMHSEPTLTGVQVIPAAFG